jgi:autotransporter family porin
MEPFVIGSLWGTISPTTIKPRSFPPAPPFILKDDLKRCGARSLPASTSSTPAQTPQCSAKLDVTFGDDIDGVGGEAGMRVSW